MKKLIWTALILLSPMLCSSALACTCATEFERTPDQERAERLKAFNAAAAVFTGEAVREHDGKVIFKVDRIWKGGSVDEIAMTNYRTIEFADGTVLVFPNAPCEYRFNVGDKFLIYASSYWKGFLKASTCGRTTDFNHTKLYEQEIKGLNEITQSEIPNRERK